MTTLLTILFVILCFFFAIIILIQQGKGDMGLGSMAGGQMLFGGSGGQNFFERATWIMGALFIFGSLGLAILKSKEVRSSRLQGLASNRKGVNYAHKTQRPLDERLKTLATDMPMTRPETEQQS